MKKLAVIITTLAVLASSALAAEARPETMSSYRIEKVFVHGTDEYSVLVARNTPVTEYKAYKVNVASLLELGQPRGNEKKGWKIESVRIIRDADPGKEEIETLYFPDTMKIQVRIHVSSAATFSPGLGS